MPPTGSTDLISDLSCPLVGTPQSATAIVVPGVEPRDVDVVPLAVPVCDALLHPLHDADDDKPPDAASIHR
jgi:hypothetical protein